MPLSATKAAFLTPLWLSFGYWWRLGVLACCFAAFGIGGIFFTLVVFPLMRLLPGGVEAHRRRARRLVRGCFGALIVILRGTGTMTLETRNVAQLADCRHRLVLAN